MKNRRHEAILEIINEQPVATQELLIQLLAKRGKSLGAIVDTLQKNALVQECPAAKAQLPQNHLGFFIQFIGVVHVRN